MDAEEFRKQLAGAEAVNAEVRLRAKRAEFEREAEVARRRAEAVNAEIVQAAAARTKALADASIGVAGLEFTEDGEATYKGDPLMRMSDGQKAAILAQFLLAGDPPFPLILWRRASLLDPAHLADFCRVVREKGAQAVLELVQETEGGLMLVAADDGTLPTSK